MLDADIQLFLQVNEPIFEAGGVQYSVCCPDKGFSTWDSTGKTQDFGDIQSLLDDWQVDGKPFRNVVESIM